VALNNGVAMPQVGLGLARVAPDEAAVIVGDALAAGYRSVDTAADYGNEEGVGRALAKTDVLREEIFVTSKVRNSDHGHGATLTAFDETLARLGLDSIDLYLIHWPVPSQDLYPETWAALEDIYAAGRARAIGVSNFEAAHLRRLLAGATVVPAVNQIELHPRLQQAELRALNAELGIATVAYSPMAKARTLVEPELVTLAERRGVTPAQLILRWHLDLGNVVIPKTVNPGRMRENLSAVALDALTDEEREVFARLENDGRIGMDPNTFA
jgi:diketogulonate reductase-like aldo/keto reductase